MVTVGFGDITPKTDQEVIYVIIGTNYYYNYLTYY